MAIRKLMPCDDNDQGTLQLKELEEVNKKKSYMQFTGVEEVCININKP